MKNSFILFLYFISVVICSKSYAVNSTNNDIEISGPAKVCLITPITYSIVKPKSGIIYKWKVIGGIIQGSDNTNELVVVFLSKETSYAVKITSYKKANPNLIIASKTLSITKIQPTISILGKDEAISSSYENYKCGYLDGDDYLWSIYPAEAGSIVEGNTTNNIKILWHNYTKGIPYIRLKVRKCNTLYYADYPVTLLFPPEITIEVPDSITINRKNIFTINLNSRINTIKQIDWDFGNGDTFTTNTLNLTHAYAYTTINTNNTQYTVTVVIYGANGCIYPATANIDITVLPAPVATLTPAVTIVACNATDINTTYFVNIQTGFGPTTNIDWYFSPNNLIFTLISGASGPNATTYHPTAFGLYYAVVSNGTCSTATNINVIRQQCPVSCTGAPILSPLIITHTGCNTFTAALTTPVNPAPYQFSWLGSGGVVITSTNSNSCSITVNQPGSYYVAYTAGNIHHNAICESSVSENFFVPYMADLRYTIGCNNTSNTYDVTLLNHSVVASGFTIANYEFNINGGPWINLLTAQNYTIPSGLAPGTHQVGIRISTPGQLSCTKIITLPLPAFPVATFTPNALTTCPDTQINFVPTDTTVGNIYFWQFGDGSTNYQQSPIKTYDNHNDNPNLNNVSLTVTNPLGCSATYTYPNIEATIYGANMTGIINMTPSNGIACQGGLITLSYTPDLNIQTPASYEWHKEGDASFMVTTTSPSYNPTTSGTYWLVVYNANGCKRIIGGGKIVSFIPVPTPVIKGPTSACLANWFTLDGYVGSDVAYIWRRNTTVIANTPSITQIETVAGTYFYTLQLTTTTGTICSSTVTTHQVTILNQPVAPTITITNVDCGKYRITLHASAAEPGFFSWSNGGSGSTTIVTSGGPVQVRFTNLAGCSSTAQIMIPHAPSYYLWVFPRGCYEFCKKDIEDTVGTIIGPLEAMPEWQWLIDNTIVDANTDTLVPVLPIIDSGTYQLALGTGLCPTVEISQPLNIAVTNTCPACPYEVTVVDIVPQHDMYNNLYYDVLIQINNTSGSDSYSSLLNAPGFGGTFIPSGITILDGPNNYNFIFIPPANFTQGMLTFYFNSETPCIGNFKITFPPYTDDKALPISEKITRDTAYLYAVPNPSKDTTLLYFNSGIAEDNENYTLVIYDTTGRILLEKNCSSKGSIPLNFSTFPVGMYSILMKNGATIVNRTKFIKN